MSSLMRPIGPESPGVYWLRRAFVALVALFVVVLLMWILGSCRGGGSEGGGAAASSSSAPTTTAPAPEPAPTSEPAPTTSAPTDSTSAAPDPSGPCEDTLVSLEVSTDGSEFPVGGPVPMRLAITNTSADACSRDVGADVNELRVIAGGAQLWSSDACEEPAEPKVVTLAPGEAYVVDYSWDGRTNDSGCSADQPLATQGIFDLQGRNGNNVSGIAKFSLVEQ